MNKIKLTAFVLFFGAMSYLNAQENRLELTIGVASPLGDFGDTDFNNDEASYAESGANIGFSYEHRFENNVGAKFMFNYQSHSIDNESLLEDFQEDFAMNGIYSVGTSGFKINNVMGGITGTLPFGESNFSLTGQTLIGLSFVTSSNLEFDYTDGAIFLDVKQEEGTAAGFSILLGAKINYDFSDSFGMNFGFDTYTTSLKFSDVKTTTRSSYGNETEQSNFEQTINTFNTSLGFYLSF